MATEKSPRYYFRILLLLWYHALELFYLNRKTDRLLGKAIGIRARKRWSRKDYLFMANISETLEKALGEAEAVANRTRSLEKELRSYLGR